MSATQICLAVVIVVLIAGMLWTMFGWRGWPDDNDDPQP